MQTINKKKINVVWLSRWTQRYSFTPTKGAFIVLMVNILTTVPVAILFGVWFPNSKTTGLSTQPDAWFNDYLVAPIIIGYFIWTRTAIGTLLDKLISDGILQNNSMALDILTKYKQSTKII
jgi:branched-subunit amino acid transport protein